MQHLQDGSQFGATICRLHGGFHKRIYVQKEGYKSYSLKAEQLKSFTVE
jgi:hypothetical protein